MISNKDEAMVATEAARMQLEARLSRLGFDKEQAALTAHAVQEFLADAIPELLELAAPQLARRVAGQIAREMEQAIENS